MHPVDLQTTALAIISRNQQCHSSAAACSFSREQNTVSTCRALTSPASPACPNPHSVLRHHSPAALLSRYLLTRFRALALFGRRSAERVVSSRRRAAENLTNSCREQMQQRGCGKRDHSITSSARSRIDVGNSTPISRTVLKLTTSSKFETCSTGRSAALAPLKILAM